MQFAERVAHDQSPTRLKMTPPTRERGKGGVFRSIKLLKIPSRVAPCTIHTTVQKDRSAKPARHCRTRYAATSKQPICTRPERGDTIVSRRSACAARTSLSAPDESKPIKDRRCTWVWCLA